MNDKPTSPSTAGSPDVSNALGLTQQSLLAFQKMQEDTARLHKQFLDNQHAALTTLQTLVAQQQALLTGQPIPFAVQPLQAFTRPGTAFASPVIEAPALPKPALPVAVTPKAPLTAPAEKPASVGRDTSAILLSVVAEKTGYPAEMLGLDMALDADLGIDSIKRVGNALGTSGKSARCARWSSPNTLVLCIRSATSWTSWAGLQASPLGPPSSDEVTIA